MTSQIANTQSLRQYNINAKYFGIILSKEACSYFLHLLTKKIRGFLENQIKMMETEL